MARRRDVILQNRVDDGKHWRHRQRREFKVGPCPQLPHAPLLEEAADTAIRVPDRHQIGLARQAHNLGDRSIKRRRHSEGELAGSDASVDLERLVSSNIGRQSPFGIRVRVRRQSVPVGELLISVGVAGRRA